VYVRFDSPPPSLSAPCTDKLVVVPATVEGDALAAVATVGAASVTVTLAVPFTLPLAAVIVAEPDAYEAVYKPDVLTDPAPLLLHVIVGWVESALPN
jgi:hypothetical protein